MLTKPFYTSMHAVPNHGFHKGVLEDKYKITEFKCDWTAAFSLWKEHCATSARTPCTLGRTSCMSVVFPQSEEASTNGAVTSKINNPDCPINH